MMPISLLSRALYLDAATFRALLEQQGPSLGLWRATEVAVVRELTYNRPVLDLGCGDGLVTSMVLPQVEVGLDPNPKALEQAAKQGIYQQLIAATAQEARLPDESIGTVLTNSVLEHIPQIDSVLEAIARMLQPGGKLILTTPTDAFSEWLALPIARYATARNRQLVHLNLWLVEQWAQHLGQVGLEIEEVRPYLRRELVSIWDALELLQQIWIAKRRVFGLIWRRIPPSTMERMAQWASHLDLSASTSGGGHLIVVGKP